MGITFGHKYRWHATTGKQTIPQGFLKNIESLFDLGATKGVNVQLVLAYQCNITFL